MELRSRAAGFKLGATTTVDRDFFVLGMNTLSHGDACDPNKSAVIEFWATVPPSKAGQSKGDPPNGQVASIL